MGSHSGPAAADDDGQLDLPALAGGEDTHGGR